MKAFMQEAIALALKGEGFTHPNPLVGAVIVKDDKIIASGYHRRYGDLHAERDALRDAAQRGVDVRGASMFVTLEPCCHQGKQPPCTEALIQSGISRVYIGSRDPNPLVNGKGVQLLRDAGIEVVQDFMREECDAINPVFFHYVKTRMPYVIVKYAMTADGLTATRTGKSKWISGEKSREYVHRVRAGVSGVMTGINTVLADNPMLNVRLNDNKEHHQPVRIIIDKNVQLPLDSQIVQSVSRIPVMDFCGDNLDEEALKRKMKLADAGVLIFQSPVTEDGHLDLEAVLKTAGENNIDSILVESGGALNSALLFSAGKTLVNELHVFVAPKIFGSSGKDGSTTFNPVRGFGADEVSDAIVLSEPQAEFFDGDVLLKYRIERRPM